MLVYPLSMRNLGHAAAESVVVAAVVVNHLCALAEHPCALAEHPVAMAAAKRSGWVGWAGTVERYPLTSRPGVVLAVGVAKEAACGRLGHLHAGSVWNGAVHLANLIECGFLRERLRGRTVCELGAGAGLPSLVALAADAESAPRAVVLTDYDDAELIRNLEQNVTRNSAHLSTSRARALGLTWGTDPAGVLQAAAELEGSHRCDGFDVVLVADCLWNSDPHEGLLQTLTRVLRQEGEVWMSHCHHWPGHDAADRSFFARATSLGFRVERWETGDAAFACLFEDDETQQALLHRLTWAATAAPPVVAKTNVRVVVVTGEIASDDT